MQSNLDKWANNASKERIRIKKLRKSVSRMYYILTDLILDIRVAHDIEHPNVSYIVGELLESLEEKQP